MSARWTGVVVLGAVAGLLLLAVLAGAEPYRAVGNADPGAWVAGGTPVVRLLADLAGAACVGSLAFACMTASRRSGFVTADAYRERGVAARAAAVWAVAAAVEVPLSAADTAGLPLTDVLGHLPALLGAMEGPRAWLLTALLAAAVAVAARAALRWPTLVALTAVGLFAVLPPVVTGHGSADLGHDLALGALILHVPAAMLWLGVAFAVLRRRNVLPEAQLTACRRATGLCSAVVAASGILLGVVLVPGTWFASGYGLLLVAKVVVTSALVSFAVIRRRRPGFAPELVLLTAGFVAAADLTHTPVPGFFARATTTAETVLGYDLAGPPTAFRLLSDWRIDVVWAPVAVLLAAGYPVLVRRVEQWPWPRTAAWLGGCLLMLLATSSGLGRYAAAMFSCHLAAHMLLSMLVPALLVLGRPGLLLRRSVPAVGRRLGVLGQAGPVRFVLHPVVVLLLFAGSPFVLYATGLFDVAIRFHWAHLLIDAWFLVVGLVFFRLVLGDGLPNIARLGLLLAAMPADVLFAAYVMTTPRVIGNGPAAAQMYQALHLPWLADLLADQWAGGVVALAVGEFALLVALGGLLARWHADEAAYLPQGKETEEKWRRTSGIR
ncbi:cytochrome c oxidase assembly protein [Amycolatopsis tolypomycina]|uniref:cytochrome c oxidase assembly protein n=1 Tax=Amycolatopsis tolypomycina TaxID=208445 RepID=UPI0033BBE1AF